MPDEGAAPGRFRWLTRHIPTRDTIHEHRLLRRFAPHLAHPSLWRMNRRSVPRGVAVGLFVGVIIPFMHTFVAALLAIPTRANVAVAAVAALVINPLTIPAMYYGAYRIGSWELHHDATLVTAGEFFDAFHKKADLYHRLHTSSSDVPNVSGAEPAIEGLIDTTLLEEMKLDWGEESAIYAVRALGEFLESAARGAPAPRLPTPARR